MCAIMGVLEKNDKTVEESVLLNMQKCLYHRGPNDQGIYMGAFGSEKNNLGVGFDRLSIRDLSIAGHQPMFSDDKSVMIAFNGEIYNSEELRELHFDKDFVFNGHSDTEVILNLYIMYGIDKLLELLDGMFAICILDKKINKLYLVRDRIGEKPLYIYNTNDLLLFASEYKAFYAHPSFCPKLNNLAIDEYFLFRYTAGTETFLENVVNLTPGSYIEINENLQITKKTYWTIPGISNNCTFEENKAKFNKLLEKSVRRRLISDVPVGIQLSGGIDSSYLAYTVSKYIKEPLHTYCIVFKGPAYSEEKYIDYVNDKFNFNLHKYDFSPDDFLTWWKKSIWHFEAPMNHEGTLALGLLNKESKDNVTVMLCGDGPDESMGGYQRMFDIMSLIKDRQSLFKWRFHLKNIKRKVRGLSLMPDTDDYSSYYISLSQWITDDVFYKLRPSSGEKGLEKVYKKRNTMLENEVGSDLRKFLNYEMHTYMQDILMRSDKISMASSIEVRVPYLMPELIEFVTTIPDEQLVDIKIGGNKGTKKLLKSLAEDVFGSDFTYRNKMGLSFPFLKYFSNNHVEQYIENAILPGIKKRNIVDYDYVIYLWNERKKWLKDKQDPWRLLHSLWICFSFELWAQMYIDNNPINLVNDEVN